MNLLKGASLLALAKSIYYTAKYIRKWSNSLHITMLIIVQWNGWKNYSFSK